MILDIKQHIHSFFERNLFERIIIYLFISALATKIIFEGIMGQFYFVQSQNQQWIFFSLLGLDYLISFRKIINIKVTINPISIFAFALLFMVLHGLFIGIMNGNNPFIILNDTVPPLMIALNVLRMQSITEIQNSIDFQFIFRSVVIIAALTSIIGLSVGKASLGNNVIYYPLILTALIYMRPFPKWAFVLILISLALSINDINRTTILFITLTLSAYIGWQALHNPIKAALSGLLCLIIASTIWFSLPTESQTYKRLSRVVELDFKERTGSIGERQAEQDAVNESLQLHGKTTEMLGLGFGGVYDVQFTNEYLTDYGHAHYAWVWFKLRFGQIGYLYMMILACILVFNIGKGLNQKDEIGLFTALLCLLGSIYIFTYVNSIFLLSGLHFLYIHKNK